MNSETGVCSNFDGMCYFTAGVLMFSIHERGIAVGYRKLGLTTGHRKALLRNLVTSLFKEEKITTTEPRAKEVQSIAERMVTLAKKGDLAARRQALRYIYDEEVVQKLFANIGPRYTARSGGYTRILKVGQRRGDAAEMVILELV